MIGGGVGAIVVLAVFIAGVLKKKLAQRKQQGIHPQNAATGASAPMAQPVAFTQPVAMAQPLSMAQPVTMAEPLPLGQPVTMAAQPAALLPLEATSEGRTMVRREAALQLLKAWELSAGDLAYGESLGSGGQAEVFKGTWMGVEVAIKRARRNNRSGAAAEREKVAIQETVRREVRALSRVRHPNVVRLFGACLEPYPAVVMAYASGGTLQDALENGVCPRAGVPLVRLMCGIARGMEAVHAHKIIHLDLKPENVLISDEGTPWVTDFGLSTSARMESLSLSSAGGRGTLAYKAPELFQNPPDVTPSADVYAFGLLAWAVITGEQPWGTMISAETALPSVIRSGERPSKADGSDWRDLANPLLARLIESCWDAKLLQRPAFGGDGGLVSQLHSLEGRLLNHKASLEDLEKMSNRVFAAEAEAISAQVLIEQYDAALPPAAPDGEKGNSQATTSTSPSTASSLTESQIAAIVEERASLAVTKAMAEANARDAQRMLESEAGAAASAETVAELRKMLAEMANSLAKVQDDVRYANTTLDSLAMGELDYPRLVFIMPEKPAGNLIARVRGRVVDKFRLHFMDPVSGAMVRCGKDGLGYQLTIKKKWLVEHGGRISDGLRVMKAMLAVGNLVGLPIPDVRGMPVEVVTRAEARAVCEFEAVLNEAGATKSGRHAKATGKAYRALASLIAEQCNDRALLHCGLVKVRSPKDGTVEWVSPASKERFETEGSACLLWNRSDMPFQLQA